MVFQKYLYLISGVMVTLILSHFFTKIERSTNIYFVASWRLSFQHGICILRQVWLHLDGNKLAKCMCLFS